jgi:hypothetical protein
MLRPSSPRSIGGKWEQSMPQNSSEQHIRDINTDMKVKGQTYHSYIFERVKDDGTRGKGATNLARLRRRGKTLKRRASNFTYKDQPATFFAPILPTRSFYHSGDVPEVLMNVPNCG